MTLLRKSGIWYRTSGCLLRVLSAGLLLCLPLAAYGWSERGHIAIVEQAMQHLSSREREELNKIAGYLVEKDPALKQLQQRRPMTPATALTAAWFDDQRGRTVREIFSRYGRRIPPQLQSYSAATTDDWHYSNLLYDDKKLDWATCPNALSGKLSAVLSYLPNAFASASDPRDKAIVLAILIHLVADAHQPLHNVTHATDSCEHDRGGNRFCVSNQRKRGRCDVNLHQLWDQGFGSFSANNNHAFADRTNWAGLERRLQPADWQKENLALAEAIYNTPEGHTPSAEYSTWAMGTVRQRSGLAAARLAHLLSRLMVSK